MVHSKNNDSGKQERARGMVEGWIYFGKLKNIKNIYHPFDYSWFFSIFDFLRRSRKKNKYRWFKVEGLGDG